MDAKHENEISTEKVNIPRTSLNVIDYEDFFNRYVYDREEFAFRYKDKLILVTYETWIPCVEFGDREKTSTSFYQHADELVNRVKFKGKTFRDIWDELEYIPL